MATKHVQFAKIGTTGLQTVTGVGFTGTALLLWGVHLSSDGLAAGVEMSIGMADADTVQSVRYMHHPGGESSTSSAMGERTDRVVYRSGTGPLVTYNPPDIPSIPSTVEGRFVGFTSDGFTIDWVVNDGSTGLFQAFVIGDDVLASLRHVKLNVNAPTEIDVNDVAFRPTAFIGMAGVADEFGTGDYGEGAPCGAVHGFGFSNATDQICCWTQGRGINGDGPADSNSGQHTDRFTSMRVSNLAGAAELAGTVIAATRPAGFTIRRVQGSTTHQPIHYVLCLRGLRFEVGLFTTPAAPGDVVLDVPFTASAVLLQSVVPGNGMNMSTGVWDDSGSQGGTWVGGVDASNPSVYRSDTYSDQSLRSRSPATGTTDMEIEVSAVASGSVTLALATVPAVPRSVIYMAVGPLEKISNALVFGVKTTVTASLAAAFGLDNARNILNRQKTLKIFGDFEVTGTFAAGSLVIGEAGPLDSVSDVVVASPTLKQVIQHDGSAFKNSKIQYGEYDNGNSGTSITIDWSRAPQQVVTLNNACTFTFTNGVAGKSYTLILIQDATGGRVPTLPSTVKFRTAPTYSTGANKVDVLTMRYTSKKSGIYAAAFRLDVGGY